MVHHHRHVMDRHVMDHHLDLHRHVDHQDDHRRRRHRPVHLDHVVNTTSNDYFLFSNDFSNDNLLNIFICFFDTCSLLRILSLTDCLVCFLYFPCSMCIYLCASDQSETNRKDIE